MQKKIIKIAVVDPVGAKAGMDYYSQNLLVGFANNGVQSYLFSNVKSGAVDQIKSVNVFALFSHGIVAKVLNLVKGHVKAAWLCRKHNIDVVILHVFSTNMGCLIGFFITRMFGLKVLAIVHDVDSFAGDDNGIAGKLIYGGLSRWVSVHNKMSQSKLIKKLASSGSKKNVYIAEHGSFVRQVNPAVTKSSARKQLGLAEKGLHGLFFGQIKKTKGLDVLIRAWGKSNLPCKLIIAGKPWKQSFDEYQLLIEKHGIENSVIKLIRYIEDHERDELFKAADFIVLPYSEIYQSGVMLMAMSYGLPIVATDIDGFAEIIDSAQCGMLFHLNDSDDLNKKIMALVNSDVLLSKYSENAKLAIATKYDWDTIAEQHLKGLGMLEPTRFAGA